MRVKVLYLGGSRGQAGCAEEVAELAADATVQDAAQWVAEHHPELAPLLHSVRWAQNSEFAEPTAPLSDGDELALLPPVSGGSGRAYVRHAPLDVGAVIQRVADPSMGCTVVFVGTVRDNARGQAVEQLDYEAYEPMATRQLERIAAECSTDGVQMAIDHRVGPLDVGEISVVIAAAAPHREAAFNRCRDAIERIKADVPIWKREVGPGGESWVGWGGG